MRKITKRIIIAVATIAIVFFVWLEFFPHGGTGSVESAQKWAKRFANLHSIDAAHKKYPDIVVFRTFPNGEWIYGICEDSHSSPWGGTIVIRDSKRNIRCFFGHVCGPGFLNSILNFSPPENINSVYSKLLQNCNFEEYKPKKNM